MGTNYYLQRKNPETGRTRDIHICKTSGGWTPSMRGYRDGDSAYANDWYDLNIQSWQDWKWFLLKETKSGGMIFNEYDEKITLKKFIRHIEDWQVHDFNGHQKKNHAIEARSGAFSDGEMDSHARACWVDSESYSFHDGEFS